MVLDNSGYPLWFEFLILCCVLISLLLVAGMGILLGLSAGPPGRVWAGDQSWDNPGGL